MANPINPPHTNRKKRKKRKVFNRNQLESNIKREEVINKLRWYPQQRVHTSIHITCWQHPFPHIPNTQTHPGSKSPVPKPSSQKPGSLSLNSWTSTVPLKPSPPKPPKPSTYLQKTHPGGYNTSGTFHYLMGTFGTPCVNTDPMANPGTKKYAE